METKKENSRKGGYARGHTRKKKEQTSYFGAHAHAEGGKRESKGGKKEFIAREGRRLR